MNSKDKILKSLLDDENFDEKILFEQYKLYVEMMNHVSERRDKTNKFYIGLISIISTISSIIISTSQKYLSLIILIISILICWNWYENIKSYQKLNKGKFYIINEIEKKLPAKGFTKEWEIIKKDNYNELTNIEKNIPLYFIILCILLIIIDIYLTFF